MAPSFPGPWSRYHLFLLKGVSFFRTRFFLDKQSGPFLKEISVPVFSARVPFFSFSAPFEDEKMIPPEGPSFSPLFFRYNFFYHR